MWTWPLPNYRPVEIAPECHFAPTPMGATGQLTIRLQCPLYQPVHAVEDGVVLDITDMVVSTDAPQKILICVEGSSAFLVYGYFATVNVKKGDSIKQGSLIGLLQPKGFYLMMFDKTGAFLNPTPPLQEALKCL